MFNGQAVIPTRSLPLHPLPPPLPQRPLRRVGDLVFAQLATAAGDAAVSRRPQEGDIPALPAGAHKLCIGIVESAAQEPFASAVSMAGLRVFRACSDMTPGQRQAMAAAIGLNLLNRKRFPADRLLYQYDLPVGKKRFYRERRRYCLALLGHLGLLDIPRA